MSDEQAICELVERAFAYRGDVTVTLKDGAKVEGYLFDRRTGGATPGDCTARMLVKDGEAKVVLRYSEIAEVEFTGRDPADGQSYRTWQAKHSGSGA